MSVAADRGLASRLRGQAGDDRGEGRGGHRPGWLLPAHRLDHDGVAHGVPGPKPGQAPRLGQRPEHDEAAHLLTDHRLELTRHGVHEGLVDHDGPAGSEQDPQDVGRVQHAGRVGGVPDHDQIGTGRHPSWVQLEPFRRREEQAFGVVPGGEQGRLGFGELGVHDQGPPGGERASEQREGLRPARGRQHLVEAQAVGRGDGLGRLVRAGIGRQTAGRRADHRLQPAGRLRDPDVHGEVDQPLSDVAVAVVVQIRFVSHHWGSLATDLGAPLPHCWRRRPEGVFVHGGRRTAGPAGGDRPSADGGSWRARSAGRGPPGRARTRPAVRRPARPPPHRGPARPSCGGTRGR